MANPSKTPTYIDFCLMFAGSMVLHSVVMAKEPAMVQIETKIDCVCDSSRLMAIVGFQLRLLLRRCNLCNPPVVPVRRSGQARRRPSEHFDRAQQFGNAPQSPGAPGGGRASFPRGSSKEPGNSASRISKDFGQRIWSHIL